MALLRAVGERGSVVSYEARDDFARTAMTNIERYLGPVANLTVRKRDTYEGIDPTDAPFDRVVLDLPEPWRVVPHAVNALRPGGLYLSYVPTVPQIMQTVEALERAAVFGLIQTFETLLRTWNIQGRSVRPDHRMVAHSGFITVARKIEAGLWTSWQTAAPTDDEPDGNDDEEPGA
jgi:tRNA (adenine57-N1/adenine58-N1)-methyltransferase